MRTFPCEETDWKIHNIKITWTTMALSYLALLATIIFAVEGTKFGIGVRVTPKGLDYLRDYAIKEVKKEISTIQIPPIQGSADVTIGTVDYTVSGMQISMFEIGSATVDTVPDVGLRFYAQDINLDIYGNWKYELDAIIPLSDSGTFVAEASSISLGLTIEVGVDSYGKPTVSSYPSDCTFNIDDLSITLHGASYSWLYDLFEGTIKESIMTGMNQQGCKQLTNSVNNILAQQLSALSMDVKVMDIMEVDCSLLMKPQFNNSMETVHRGEVYALNYTEEAPIKRTDITRDSDVSQMIFVWVSKYVPNTAGYALHNAGLLKYVITQDNLPPEFKFNLSTSSLPVRLAIPAIRRHYPDCPMIIKLQSATPPNVTISPDLIQGHTDIDVSAYAKLKNGSVVFMFTIRTSVDAFLKLGVSGMNVTWKCTSIKIDMKLLRSQIGQFSLFRLREAVKIGTKRIVIPRINAEGKTGYPIPPVPMVTVDKVTLIQGKGFLKIGVDLQ